MYCGFISGGTKAKKLKAVFALILVAGAVPGVGNLVAAFQADAAPMRWLTGVAGVGTAVVGVIGFVRSSGPVTKAQVVIGATFLLLLVVAFAAGVVAGSLGGYDSWWGLVLPGALGGLAAAIFVPVYFRHRRK